MVNPRLSTRLALAQGSPNSLEEATEAPQMHWGPEGTEKLPYPDDRADPVSQCTGPQQDCYPYDSLFGGKKLLRPGQGPFTGGCESSDPWADECVYGGATAGTFMTTFESQQPDVPWSASQSQTHNNKGAHMPWNGFQIIMLEYDANDEIDYPSLPAYPSIYGTETTATGHERDYVGPKVNVYAMAQKNKNTGSQGYSSWVPPFAGNQDFDHPILTGSKPALKDHLLFGPGVNGVEDDPSKRRKMFLGGTPPLVHEYADGTLFAIDWWHPVQHGFRGMMYEFMMFEGKLSRNDRKQLEDVFKKKYQFPLNMR